MSVSDFDLAIPTVLRHEGGFVDDANDPGGATNYGVSLRWLKSKGLISDLEHKTGTDDAVSAVKKMTRDEAAAFYKEFWWDAYKYEEMAQQIIATKVLDMAVNLGAPRAHRFVQTVVGAQVDGVLGEKTFALINEANPFLVIKGLQLTQATYYRELVQRNPRLQEFLNGWLNRAYDQN